MKSVAIIGAGITGLTAAFYLKRKGVPVTVYEAGERVGGVIQSIRRDGFLAENGPNTILETSPKIAQLVRDAGLASRRLNSDSKAEARYLVRYQRPIPMPGSPLEFFTTRLFTVKAKLAVLREPFVPRRADGKEESVADFVKRRLNQEFLDQAIDALAAGVYAGDPYKLSVPEAFPRLAALEARYGSLIKGQIFGARERRRRGDIARDRAPKFSFDEGLQVLPDGLARQLGDAIKLDTMVTRLTQTNNGWALTLSEGRVTRVSEIGHAQSWSLRNLNVEHSAVIYCGTAYKLADLHIETNVPLAPSLSPPSGERVTEGQEGRHFMNLAPFSEIRYPPVASVVLGFRRKDVAHPCQGFGMLIPKVEGFKILGTIFSSSLFPNRAPAGHITLTSYVGGERRPDLALRPADELVTLTCEDLRVLLGVNGRPVFRHTALYPKAIPQYNLGYGRYRALMNAIENQAAGFFLAGHYREGVSLGDSMVSGCNVVERVEKFLTAK
ncbi:MAG TPA: protoporphyrinogen oxidase [Candidatus Sulfopaludibacter sp.]|nr:protoporphyrinogen oxidase [Candidatus Sulfopaludibacter sp.]